MKIPFQRYRYVRIIPIPAKVIVKKTKRVPSPARLPYRYFFCFYSILFYFSSDFKFNNHCFFSSSPSYSSSFYCCLKTSLLYPAPNTISFIVVCIYFSLTCLHVFFLSIFFAFIVLIYNLHLLGPFVLFSTCFFRLLWLYIYMNLN